MYSKIRIRHQLNGQSAFTSTTVCKITEKGKIFSSWSDDSLLIRLHFQELAEGLFVSFSVYQGKYMNSICKY